MYVLVKILNLYILIIIIRAVMSWFQPNPYNPVVRFVYMVTEPVLRPLRQIIPPVFGGMDLSPIIAILIIYLIIGFIV